MIEFGKTLRAAREAKGLSVAQLAEMTHMTPARVEELEAENFASIPAAIYGRGFVRLYCSAVDLDPKPLSDEFTEIFNGNRDPEIRERALEPEPIHAKADSVDSRAAEEDLARQEDDLTRSHGATEAGLVDFGEEASSMEGSQSLTEGPTPTPSDNLFDEPTPTPTSVPHPSSDRLRGSLRSGDTHLRVSPDTEPEATSATEEPHGPTLSRYAAPLHDRPKLAVPASVWRLALLGCAALLVLWALAVGVRALYRATGGTTGEAPSAEAAPAETPPPSASAKTDAKPTPSATETPVSTSPADGPRTPQKIPALYID